MSQRSTPDGASIGLSPQRKLEIKRAHEMLSSFSNELNELIAGERLAEQICDMALAYSFNPGFVEAVAACRDCHRERVQKLINFGRRGSNETQANSRLAGTMAKMIEHCAKSETDCLALLEQLESEQLANYDGRFKKIPSHLHELTSKYLLPAQQRTHLIISSMLSDAAKIA